MDSAFSNKNISRFILFFSCSIICIIIFFPFLTTVGVAVIFALVLNPFLKRIQRLNIIGFSIKSRRKCTALLLFVLIMLFAVPFGVMGAKIYSRLKNISDAEVTREELSEKVSEYTVRFEAEVSKYIGKLGLKRKITVDELSGGFAQKAAHMVFDAVTRLLALIPTMLMSLIIFIVALYYLLAESEKIENFFHELGLFSFREINIVSQSLKESSYSAVVSTVMAGVVHGLIVAIGAQIMGAGDFSFVFMLTFFLSFIPVIGAALVALSLCVPALANQNYSAVFVLLGIALFASGIDNIVRPYFLVYGNHLVHPFISLLSVLGGISVFGMSGLFLGPVLVQVTIESLPKLVRLKPNPKNPISRRPIDYKSEADNG